MSDRARRRQAVLAGHEDDPVAARDLLTDPSAPVRAAALGALARLGSLAGDELAAALTDPEAAVRRRAAELAAARADVSLVPLLSDTDDSVVEAAAWACGERTPTEPGAVDALAAVVRSHADPLCREAAVAALGALGEPDGLAAILAATRDKPAVRRRAVLALAAFDGPEVDEALERALADRDWQVRQAAEDLLG